MNRNNTLLIAILLISTLLSSQVQARSVVVNNQRMNAVQLQYLDQISCNYVPDGNYWLDVSSGKWGYAGGGMQGYITDKCNKRRPSLSERGLLYSPGELMR